MTTQEALRLIVEAEESRRERARQAEQEQAAARPEGREPHPAPDKLSP